MKLPLIISALTVVSAVRVPNTWPQQPNQTPNNVNRDNQQIRQDGFLPQQGSTYNNINPFINNIPNIPAAGLIAPGNIFSNLPVNYNNWFYPNLVNNNRNQLVDPHHYQRLNSPPAPETNYNVNPEIPRANPYREVQSQVPYRTSEPPRTAAQSTYFKTLPQTQDQRQRVNANQAVSTTAPITELDFSPLDPFPHRQQDFQASTQINNHNNMFDTDQLLNGYDPFSQNPQANRYQHTQRNRQISFTKPLLQVADNRGSKYTTARTPKLLDFDPFKKGYRDHRTHEPTEYDADHDREAVPIPKRLETERAPIVTNHEFPAEVPTRPLYPGEAKWSKPGVKHRPFISKQQYKNLDESNEQPDGHDTFEEAQKLFEKQQQQFGLRSKQLSRENNSPPEEASANGSDEGEAFVPTRLYAQVRHSEEEKHLPPQSDENGRLKELVKDHKIQTIYSEEGYEDSAYDHAGHEKNAENTEDLESDEKNKEAKTKKKIPVKKYDRQSASYAIGDQDINEEDIEKLKKEDLNLENDSEENNNDSEPAGTHYDEEAYLNKGKPKLKNVENNIIKSKNIKIVTAKDKGGGKIEMEISSEVKAVRQPNNSTKLHRYVKIYPKMNKHVKAPDNIIENEIPNKNEEKEGKLEADKRSLILNDHEIFIEEIIHQTSTSSSEEEYASTTVTPTEFSEIFTMEIPATTQPTTSIPKLEVKDEESSEETVDSSELYLKPKTRTKRSSNRIPEIEIDTDFIDQINHDLGKPTEKSKKTDENKYPYYNSYKQKGLHQDSPLRYSEDLKNVPRKTPGKLAFYEHADRKMACSDVNPEVDPVPDRIKNADEGVEDEEEDEEGNDPATKGPRLGQLGDKIDCFKAKYFGDNPLDNPIFQEELVGPVQPIFSEIETISKKRVEPASDKYMKEKEPLNAAATSYDANNEIEDGTPHKYGLKSWFPGKSFGMGENTERHAKFVNHFVERNPNLKANADLMYQQSRAGNNDGNDNKLLKQPAKEVQTPATLITTPRYSLNLKPKHIYDQIQLLDYLPEDEFDEIKKAIEADLPKANKTEVTTSLPNMNKTEIVLSAPVPKKKKKSGKKNAERRSKMLTNHEERMKMETSDDRKPESLTEIDALQFVRKRPRKPLYEIFDVNKFIPKVPKIPPVAKNSKPGFLSPVVNPDYLSPVVSIRSPTYQIFDINKYLPTTPFPVLKNFITQSTVLPKYKVFSEVFYKEDIKPNEQLNVFTDVLKHIDSFPKLRDSFSDSSEPISVKLNTKKLAEDSPENAFEQDQSNNKNFFSSTIMTTFGTKMYASNHRYPQTEDPLIAERHIEDLLNTYRTTTKPKRRKRIKTTTQETPVVIEESTTTLQYTGEPTDVMGLMPPIIQGYKTIYHPKRDNSQHISSPTIMIEEKKINKYYVQGMRPPPKQKIFLYSDFLTDNHIMQRMSKPKRSKLRRRSKRDAQRPAYAEVSRNRSKTETEPVAKTEADDDYVPHRPKNYHYDEKTGKIVYDKKPQEENVEEEEVEYIEVVEESPKTTEKPKQSTIFATATPPPDGQSYTDFVKLLKSASNYHEIPDPTTTEKNAEKVTEKAVASTLQPVSTNPPEFLSILAKVRNDTTYKLIKEEKKTTTSKPAEEKEAVEEEEEYQAADVKNSPGGYDGVKSDSNLYDGLEAGANLEIFDIADFLPNIKSYLPKTAVDTSKYKTIERPQVRNRLSSRYNSEDDKDLKKVNTNKQPLLDDKETRRQRVQVTTPLSEISTQRQIRLQRRRTTTVKSVEDNATSAPQPTTAIEEPVSAENNSTMRRRRRRKRVKGLPSLEQASDAEPESTKKAVHRRSERESHLYADGNEQYGRFVDSDGTMPEISIPMEDYVDYEEVTDTDNITTTYKPDISIIAKKLLDIFKNYDKTQKHGGNYRKEDEVNKTVTVVAPEIKEKMDKPMEIFKAYDKEKKHGGNYKKEDEVNTTTPVSSESNDKTKKAVNVFKSYDKQKKHGGNYKAEKENVSKAKEQLKPINTEEVLKNATNGVFKKLNETKEHGGNYIPENEELSVSEQDESGIEKSASLQVPNVNVFQDYDKTKNHGENYNGSEESKINIELEEPKVEEVVGEQQIEGSQLRSPQVKQNTVNDDSGKKELVEAFKVYDTTKKHGGNYKAEKDVTVEEQQTQESQLGSPHVKQNVLNDNSGNKESVEVFKHYDKTVKHGGNYKSKKDVTAEGSQFRSPQNSVNGNSRKKELVEVFKNYDKTKQHGGNYKPEKYITVEEQQIQESQLGLPQVNVLGDSGKKGSVEVFKDYDITNKHGGNYKPEIGAIVEEIQFKLPQNTVNDNSRKKESIEVFKGYGKTKEHGGNYKPEKFIVVEEQQMQESQLGSPHAQQNILKDESEKKGAVEVFKGFDETKKHGGNYMREKDTLHNVNASEKHETEKVKDIETFMKYDKEQKTGGNYKSEDELLDPKAEETHIFNTRTQQNKRLMESRNDVQRLADVVLKPEAFYTDLKLPLDINALKIVTDLPAEELEEIVNSEEDDKSKEEVLRRNDRVDDVVIIGQQIKVPSLVEQPTATSTRPLFITDPSKRLYFYAPIR